MSYEHQRLLPNFCEWHLVFLSHALISSQKLVQQVEDGGDGLETELVNETEVLIEEFKVRESLENQLKAELVESHALLAEQKEQAKAMKDEKEALVNQVCP